jgi:hypothetical protein
MDDITENISFFLDEEVLKDQNIVDINNLFNNLNNLDTFNDTNNLYCDQIIPNIVYYNLNFTVKELMLICEYYNIAKDAKINKYNKEELCNFLVEFELNPQNNNIVLKRKNMWFYINELKNDKFMKKYILW